MGHWGTSILSNDTSADIKGSFFDMYNDGKPLPEIRKEIENNFKESDGIEENIDFWLTLSLLQWQVGQLDQDVKEITFKIIDEGIDIEVWRESDGDEKSLAKRKVELNKLKEKLQTINPKPKKAKKKIIPKSILPKGSVYAFPLKNEYFSAVVILEEILNPKYYFALIANTDVYSKQLPTIEQVITSRLLTQPPHQYNSTIKPLIASYTNTKHKEIIKTFIKIGEVTIKENYQDNFISFGASPWSFLLDKANKYLVENEIRSDQIFPTKDYLKTTGNWFTKLFNN